MDAITQYWTKIKALLERIVETQRESIDAAAREILACWDRGGRVWVIGPGAHSYIGLEEFCYRGGGIYNVYPMECQVLSMSSSRAHTATMFERTPGVALAIFKASGVEPKDCVFIYNQYGINSVAIESAAVARAMGVRSIGITSSEFCKSVGRDHPARHPSGRNLYELVDVHVNTWMPPGDAQVELAGASTKVAASSTLVGCFAVNLVVSRTTELALELKKPIRLTVCGNVPGADEHNRKNVLDLGDDLGFGGRKGHGIAYPTQAAVGKVLEEDK